MSTARARLCVIETDAVAAALDTAARRWPTGSRTQLLVRLALEGHRALASRDEDGPRAQAVASATGVLTGLYPPGYMDELRADWPA